MRFGKSPHGYNILDIAASYFLLILKQSSYLKIRECTVCSTGISFDKGTMHISNERGVPGSKALVVCSPVALRQLMRALSIEMSIHYLFLNTKTNLN
jgi:hypothetical protein